MTFEVIFSAGLTARVAAYGIGSRVTLYPSSLMRAQAGVAGGVERVAPDEAAGHYQRIRKRVVGPRKVRLISSPCNRCSGSGYLPRSVGELASTAFGTRIPGAQALDQAYRTATKRA